MLDRSRVSVCISCARSVINSILLAGLKRLETGAFIKDYEDANKEIEQALQMIVEEVHAEDPRYIEKPAAPLSEEFPSGSNIFFLGEHAYGVAAQVSETTENTLSVILAVSILCPFRYQFRLCIVICVLVLPL